MTNWKDSNAIVTYDLDVYKNNVPTHFTNLYQCVRVNESMPVVYLEQIKNRFPDGFDYCEVRIKEINFHKLHFMLEHMDEFEGFKVGYEKLLFTDKRIEPAEVNIMHFVNDVNDIDLLGNETIISFMDIPYVNRYMGKLANLMGPAEVIIAVDRPYDNIWGANGVWAERVKDVGVNGKIIYNKTATNIHALEKYFAPGKGQDISGRIVTDPNLEQCFLLTDMGDFKDGLPD